MTAEIQTVCDTVYGEVAAFYASKAQQMGEAAAGYEILYGPPVVRPEMFFVGYQPGGSASDSAAGLESGDVLPVPSESHYAHEKWRLAVRMQTIWGVPTLVRCTGLNAIFFRARSIQVWTRLPGDLREELEAFSIERAEKLARAMAPKQIVSIGLRTFRRLAAGKETVVLSGKRSPLVVQGIIWDIPALGVIHLSGARINGDDRAAITSHLQQSKRAGG